MWGDLKDIALWAAAGVFALLAWIFRSSQAIQDERISDVENEQMKIRDNISSWRVAFADQLRQQDLNDNERHERDRKEVKADLKEMADRNEAQHNAIVKRLDQLLNGHKR